MLLLAATLYGQDTRASRGVVLFVNPHGGVIERLGEAGKPLDLDIRAIGDEPIVKDATVLADVDLLLIQHLRGDAREGLTKALKKAVADRPALKIVALTAAAAMLGKDPDLAGKVSEDKRINAYYEGATNVNLDRLARFIAKEHFGRPVDVLPAEARTAIGLYHPDASEAFADTAAFLAWARKNGKDTTNAPRAAVTVHTLHLEFQQPAVVRALIRALEKRGFLAAAIVDSAEGMNALRDRYEKNTLDFRPDVVLHTCHSPDTTDFRKKLGVPHLSSIFFGRDSIDEWRKSAIGLDPGTLTFQIVTQELLGAIEPIACGGTKNGRSSGEAMTPIDEGIDRLADRAVRWTTLRRKKNADKKLAIIYYDREMSPSSLMRGSTTGMFMNAPRSLVKVGERLQKDGWTIASPPKTDDQLIAAMLRGGRQIGMWDKETLDRLVATGDPVLIPVERYESWYRSRIPETARKELEERWGPPPGKIMTWTNPSGASFIVCPRLDYGNVILLPQPLRGEAHDPKLLHSTVVPPPHNYLATYAWIRNEFRADAVIHFGTHGSEFFLPGKRTGLTADDWPEMCLEDLPNICPWIVDNLGEAMPAKRRSHAVIVSHQTPPLVSSGLSDELENLHRDVEKCLALESGALEKKFRESLARDVVRAGLDRDLGWTIEGGALSPDQTRALDEHLHRLREEKMPSTLHVFGEPPAENSIVPYVTTCLKKRFLDLLTPLVSHVHEKDGHDDPSANLQKTAESVVDGVVRGGLSPRDAAAAAGLSAPEKLPEELDKMLLSAKDLADRLRRASAELDGLSTALSGGFVEPGPGGSPARNPASAPGGRNLFAVNPEEIPSKASFELGKKLADEMLADHLNRHGSYPKRVAFDLSTHATFMDYGVAEAEVLRLLGVEPVWDEKGAVQTVRALSREELGRPRVDVFLSALGYYRDNLPSRMALLDAAVRKVAELDESDNAIKIETKRIKDELKSAGIAEDRAELLSRARVFGSPPGGVGSADYYYLIERSGSWDTREELMQAYLGQVQFVYTAGVDGEAAPELYRSAIQNTAVVMRNWTDPVTSPLSDKYAWFKGGSLALAVKTLTGKEPEFRLSDVRDPDRSRVVAAEDALADDLRTRLFNRKWLEGMKNEGYAGADQLAHMATNAMGWSIMRESSIRADQWQKIKEVLVDDALGLGLADFFEKENPFARREIAETLLEAIRKGYWKADAKTTVDLAQAVKNSVAAHGKGGGLRGAGNTKLDDFIASALGGPGKTAAPIVSGPKLEPSGARTETPKKDGADPAAAKPPAPDRRPAAATKTAGDTSLPLALLGFSAAILFAAGFILGKR